MLISLYSNATVEVVPKRTHREPLPTSSFAERSGLGTTLAQGILGQGSNDNRMRLSAVGPRRAVGTQPLRYWAGQISAQLGCWFAIKDFLVQS